MTFLRLGAVALLVAMLAAVCGAAADDEPAPPAGNSKAKPAEPAKLAIGQPGPAWKDLPGIDGKRHGLADLQAAKAVAVVFVDAHCPDCDEYAARLRDLDRDYRGRGVAMVLLSVGRAEEDKLDAFRAFAKEKSLSCLCLRDDSQAIGRAYGAELTPEVFLLDGSRKLAYRGAVDDHWDAARAKRRHLRQALDELLAGKPVSVPTTEAAGCPIDYPKASSRKPRP